MAHVTPLVGTVMTINRTNKRATSVRNGDGFLKEETYGLKGMILTSFHLLCFGQGRNW
jgi:hypothetical protein